MNWLFLALLAAAPVASAQPLTLRASRVWITGTSNVHDWSCEVTHPDPQISLKPTSDGPGVLPASVSLRVPVRTVACGNDTMDGKLRDALDAKAHPEIVFTLTSAQALGAADKVLARGELQIAAVHKNIAFVAHLQPGADRVDVQGDVPVELPDYGVTPPTALMGMLQTGKQVVVHFALTFVPGAR